MDFPQDLQYTKEHEWARIEGNRIVVGITDFAQEELGDVVFVELPPLRTTVEANGTFGVVESVKAVSSLYSPVTGEIVAVNTELPNHLETLNSDPYSGGWMMKVAITDEGSLGKLMDKAAYDKQVAAEG